MLSSMPFGMKGKGNYYFFFSLMKRSKNHTRSVVYEKTVHNLLKISC